MSAKLRASPTARSLTSANFSIEHHDDEAGHVARRPNKSWAKFKFEWLDQIHDDYRLNATTKVIAYTLARFANSTAAEAWPTQDTIAKKAMVSEATVRACLRKLIDLDHLKLGKTGHQNHNKYELQLLANGCADDA